MKSYKDLEGDKEMFVEKVGFYVHKFCLNVKKNLNIRNKITNVMHPVSAV